MSSWLRPRPVACHIAILGFLACQGARSQQLFYRAAPGSENRPVLRVDSNLVRVLARQSKTQIGLVDLVTLSRGAEAVRTRLAELSGKGMGAAIIDAVFDRDLETIGLVAAEHRLSVGASGIGLGLARALVSTGKVKPAAASSGQGAAVGGQVACLAGSCSQATLQWP